jgi:hypothetical protein
LPKVPSGEKARAGMRVQEKQKNNEKEQKKTRGVQFYI